MYIPYFSSVFLERYVSLSPRFNFVQKYNMLLVKVEKKKEKEKRKDYLKKKNKNIVNNEINFKRNN